MEIDAAISELARQPFNPATSLLIEQNKADLTACAEKILLARCEWGHDDYSLNVANLPMADPSPPASLPKGEGGSKVKSGARSAYLFGDTGEDS